jgi:hypothetical protein
MSQPSNKNDIKSGPSSRTEEEPEVVVTPNDIVFDCPVCKGELVVDRQGEGMSLTCVHCNATVTVPLFRDRKNRPAHDQTAAGSAQAEPPASFDFSNLSREQLASRIEDLKLQLQENESQRVETRGHVNRTTLQLHRHQLQMDRLVKRQRTIEAEVKAALDRLKAV